MRLLAEISNLDPVENDFKDFAVWKSEKNEKYFPQGRDLRFRSPIAFRAIHAASFLTTEKTRCQTEFSSKRKKNLSLATCSQNYESFHKGIPIASDGM